MTDQAEATDADTGTSGAAASGAAAPSAAASGKGASLAGRVQDRIKAASREHKANAEVPSGQQASPAIRPGAVTQAARRPPRRARLRLTRVDPWSVMKTAFLLSIAFGIVTVVSVFMVWSVLGAAGVWDSINSAVGSVLSSDGESTFDVEDYINTGRVMGFTVLVAAIDVFLLTAIATLSAFLYNMAAALLGGLDVTLAEDRP